MKLYYISRYPNQNGNHELHKANCSHLPNIFNRIWFGEYKTQQEALHDALKMFPNLTACSNCLESANSKNKKPQPFYKKWFKTK